MQVFLTFVFLCALVVDLGLTIHHKDTETTKVAQKSPLLRELAGRASRK
jgi:hypothetical protein